MANVSDRLREALERLDQAIDRLDANAAAADGSEKGAVTANATVNDGADTAAVAARLDKMIQRIEAALAN